LKEEAQDRTLWRTQFERGYGPVARHTTTWSWFYSELWYKLLQFYTCMEFRCGIESIWRSVLVLLSRCEPEIR
jgi:hypothetical protein